MSDSISGRTKRLRSAADALRLRILGREQRNGRRNEALVVALTSRSRKEGVTTVAAALARTFSNKGDGRILLIDADSANKGLLKKTCAKDIEVIDDDKMLDPDAAIPAIDGWNVDLIALAPGRDGGWGFDASRWEQYSSSLRSRYDIIVVDAGELSSGVAQFWSKAASQILLVVDSTRTSIRALERLRKELKDANVPLSGVILNKREYPVPSIFY